MFPYWDKINYFYRVAEASLQIRWSTHLAMKEQVVNVLVHRLDVDPLPIAPPVTNVIVSE